MTIQKDIETSSGNKLSRLLGFSKKPVFWSFACSFLALTISLASVCAQYSTSFAHSAASSAYSSDFKLAENTLDASKPPHPMFAQSQNLIADVAEDVAASVVNIDTKQVARHRQMPEMMASPFHDPFFDQFFGNPFGQSMQNPVMRGNGSGVVLSEDGVVLTNNHVVKSADEIVVTLNDGRKFNATVIGRDAMTDVALLKMKDAKNLKPARLGDSSHLRPGEWVVAVGSPLGFDHTVTVGIVSALSRQIPDINSNVEFIQTDAAINPGNSGGPLVNLQGEVIGINTAIAGSGQNIGFAIPVNVVKRISKDLLATGKVTRAWIGISMTELSAPISKSLGLPETVKGVVVTQVYPDSPALKAGFQQGDVIQRLDGKVISNAKELQDIIRTKPIRSDLNLQIIRDGQLKALSLKTEEVPAAVNN